MPNKQIYMKYFMQNIIYQKVSTDIKVSTFKRKIWAYEGMDHKMEL